MRKYCHGENFDLEILSRAHVLSSSEHEEMFSGMSSGSTYLCIHVWTDVRLARVCTVGRLLFIFKIEEFIHYRSMPSEYEDSNKKFWGELIAYFPLIRHGPHRKSSRCLATIREDTQTQTQTAT
jgi:hypothetical protein